MFNIFCVFSRYRKRKCYDYRHVFQRVLVEPNAGVRDVAEKVWNQLVSNAGLVELLHAACPLITTWLCLGMQPVRMPFDSSLLIHAKTQRKRSGNDGLNNYEPNVVAPKWYIGGKLKSSILLLILLQKGK